MPYWLSLMAFLPTFKIMHKPFTLLVKGHDRRQGGVLVDGLLITTSLS